MNIRESPFFSLFFLIFNKLQKVLNPRENQTHQANNHYLFNFINIPKFGEFWDVTCERLTSMRTIICERKPNDRYDVRSRDDHATDAHVSYGKLSDGTSGGASNLLAQEDLVLV